MKNPKLIICILFSAFFICNTGYAQLNVLNRVKRAVNERIDKEINKAVNKQLDTLEKKVTDKEVKNIEKSANKKIEEIVVDNKPQNVKPTKPIGKPVVVTNPKGKGKYAIKSAVIKYKSFVMGFDAQQVLYFDNYGEKEANETSMKVMGFSTTTLTIYGDNCTYTIDLNKRTATKSSLDDNPYGIDYEQLTEQMQKDWKIKNEGNETIIGKNCIKYSFTNENLSMNGYAWVWKGISLKSEFNIGSLKTLMEAESIDENISIPSEKFEIPGDVTIEEYKAED